jgi:hypothetical protein
MNSKTIVARDLLSGDFLIIKNKTYRIEEIIDSYDEYVTVRLVNGETHIFNEFDRVSVVDEDDYFEDHPTRHFRDEDSL